MAQYVSAAVLLLAGFASVLFARREWNTPSVFEGSSLFGSSRPGERRFWAIRRRGGALVLAFLGLAMLVTSVGLAFSG